MKKIRILYVLRKLDYGGIASIVMNYYRHIDKKKFHIDFIVSSLENKKYESEIKKSSTIFVLPDIIDIKKYRKQLQTIINENEYDMMHCHLNGLNFIPLSVAKRKIPIRISHCHTSSNKKDGLRHIVKTICKVFSKVGATHYFACSCKAGYWMFGKSYEKGYLVSNAIDLLPYHFKEKKRIELRKQYDCMNKYVIGHVGRFIKLKNHNKIISIFLEILKVKPEALLFLVGDGPLKEKIIQKVNQLEISDKVVFSGNIDNVAEIMQIFDIFILPSYYEGLPLVAIEAQISNLNCFLTDTITLETKIIPNTTFLHLKDDWAKNILNTKLNKRKSIYCEEFDIQVQVRKLENLYFSFMEDRL